MKQIKKRFFAKHSKSSALVFSIIIHSVILVAGLTWVVAEHFIKPEVDMVARNYTRPTMPKKPLKVPVNMTKAKPKKPKLKPQRLVAKVEHKTASFQLPDLGHLKGSLGGAASADLGPATSLGFMMPEVGLFRTKAKGEKFFLILDTGNHMLEDRMGGIPAYTIIKQELIRVVEELPPTALFNVCVFGNEGTMTLFPKLVSANAENARKAEAWLDPLNASEAAVKSGLYGMKTLGEGGVHHGQDLRRRKFAEAPKSSGAQYRQERWFMPAMVAMEQQADTVFLLTNTWGNQRVASTKVKSRDEWNMTSEGKRWNEHVQKARKKLAAENETRQAAGQPPRVIAHGDWGLMRTYYPDVTRPPLPDFYYFTPRDFTEAFDVVRVESRPEGVPEKSGLRRRKSEFTFNVVQFIPADSTPERSVDKFKKLVGLCKGSYQTIAGLDAIESYLKEQE